MFSQIKLWRVYCRKCEKYFASGGNVEDYFITKKEAEKEIVANGWHICNFRPYCGECFEQHLVRHIGAPPKECIVEKIGKLGKPRKR